MIKILLFLFLNLNLILLEEIFIYSNISTNNVAKKTFKSICDGFHYLNKNGGKINLENKAIFNITGSFQINNKISIISINKSSLYLNNFQILINSTDLIFENISFSQNGGFYNSSYFFDIKNGSLKITVICFN